ncbi:hypothetical protein L1887_62533 [Cichorium endivia]|nr:hypothetical protein L1887_62533 [Cichorium endivia]
MLGCRHDHCVLSLNEQPSGVDSIQVQLRDPSARSKRIVPIELGAVEPDTPAVCRHSVPAIQGRRYGLVDPGRAAEHEGALSDAPSAWTGYELIAHWWPVSLRRVLQKGIGALSIGLDASRSAHTVCADSMTRAADFQIVLY